MSRYVRLNVEKTMWSPHIHYMLVRAGFVPICERSCIVGLYPCMDTVAEQEEEHGEQSHGHEE
jgi:hypothetical protein